MNYITKKTNKYFSKKKAKEIALAPQEVYKKSQKEGINYWAGLAKEGIDWIKPFTKTYEKNKDSFSWFKDGQLNLCYNAVDRNLDKPDNDAIIFIPENPKEKTQKLTYFELFKSVNQAAKLLRDKNVKKGDVVAIYMPPTPEALIFMLACARIGAIHSVVFSGHGDSLIISLCPLKSLVLNVKLYSYGS